MENSIFRKSSLERISSPEQLNDYIRITSPGVWLALAAVLILVAALFIWAIFGNVPTTYTCNGEAKGGVAVCYLPLADAAAVAPGMEVQVGEYAGVVERVAQTPLSYTEAAAQHESDYAAHALGIAEWNIRVEIETNAPDGFYPLTIIAQTQKPISFLTN